MAGYLRTNYKIQPRDISLNMDGSAAAFQSVGIVISHTDVLDAEGIMTMSMDGYGKPLWVQAMIASIPGSAALASNVPDVRIWLSTNSALEGPISGSIAYLKHMAYWNEQVGSATSFIRTASFGSLAAATVRTVAWCLIGSR